TPGRASSTRTGPHPAATPMTVNDRQAEVEAVYNSMFGANASGQAGRKSATSKPMASKTPADDQSLIEKARTAKNGDKFSRLWDGNWSGYYGSESEADLALCDLLAFWTGPDPHRIDALFRQSGLFRDKWERQDYRDRTISKAL